MVARGGGSWRSSSDKAAMVRTAAAAAIRPATARALFDVADRTLP
jgi:hypothetical protein